MKNKYQKLTWIWIYISIFITLLFLVGVIYLIVQKSHDTLIPALILNFPIWLNASFEITFRNKRERMSAIARNILPYEEYFILKKSLRLNLNEKDISFAQQKIDKKVWSDFLRSYKNNANPTKTEWIFISIILILIIVGLLTYFVENQIFRIISYTCFLGDTVTFCIVISQQCINQLLFAKKVDELVENKRSKNCKKIERLYNDSGG